MSVLLINHNLGEARHIINRQPLRGNDIILASFITNRKALRAKLLGLTLSEIN